MSDTYRHKLEGKCNRYRLGMHQWYEEGTLCYTPAMWRWPTFLLGAMPRWWNRPCGAPPKWFRQIFCNRPYRHRTNQQVRAGQYEGIQRPRRGAMRLWS